LFSILGNRVVDARFLDLYAGSGAVGFEALSRGAREVVFVEADARTAASLRATAENFGVADRVMVMRADASHIASRLRGRFDLVFADPPFAQAAPYQALESLRACGRLDARSLIMYERRHSAPAFACPGWRSERTERYGEVALEFLRFDG
jgi:16S rRNA (guanine966-N2)-methyltransferase